VSGPANQAHRRLGALGGGAVLLDTGIDDLRLDVAGQRRQDNGGQGNERYQAQGRLRISRNLHEHF
jgi:hypothetical protein